MKKDKPTTSKPTFTKITLHKEIILPFEVKDYDDLAHILWDDDSFKIDKSFDEMIENNELTFKVIQDKA